MVGAWFGILYASICICHVRGAFLLGEKIQPQVLWPEPDLRSTPSLKSHSRLCFTTQTASPRTLWRRQREELRSNDLLNIKGRWVAKLVAFLLPTAALWIQIQTSHKSCKWQNKQRNSQPTLARQNYMYGKADFFLRLQNETIGWAATLLAVIWVNSKENRLYLFKKSKNPSSNHLPFEESRNGNMQITVQGTILMMKSMSGLPLFSLTLRLMGQSHKIIVRGNIEFWASLASRKFPELLQTFCFVANDIGKKITMIS